MHRLASLSGSAALAALLLAASALPLTAQRGGSARDGLDGRMRAFLEVVEVGDHEGIAGFFPRSGDWTWMPTLLRAPEGTRVGVWRFRGEETLRAISPGGELCDSFDPPGDTGTPGRTLLRAAMSHPTGWRRVRGSRFVPPEASPRSPIFVEWRREDGQWVVSAFGDEQAYAPPPRPGADRGRLTRETRRAPLPAEPAYVTGKDWFVHNEPVSFHGRRFLKYGLPRPIDAPLLERVASLDGVAFFVEAGLRETPDVLYAPVAPGEYQPFQASGDGCR